MDINDAILGWRVEEKLSISDYRTKTFGIEILKHRLKPKGKPKKQTGNDMEMTSKLTYLKLWQYSESELVN